MKLTGITGTGSGRLGSSVFSVRKGEQIVRQYQSHVANPNTPRQLEVRAGFKLLNEIATVFSDYLSTDYIVGKGTPRNGFVSHLFPSLAFLNSDDGSVVAYVPRNRISLSPRNQLSGVNVTNPSFAYAYANDHNITFTFQESFTLYANELEGVQGLRLGVLYAMFAQSQLYSSHHNLISVVPCSNVRMEEEGEEAGEVFFVGNFLTCPLSVSNGIATLFHNHMDGFDSSNSFPGVNIEDIICMAYPVIFVPRGAVAASYNGAIPATYNSDDIIRLQGNFHANQSDYVMYPVIPLQCKVEIKAND